MDARVEWEDKVTEITPASWMCRNCDSRVGANVGLKGKKKRPYTYEYDDHNVVICPACGYPTHIYASHGDVWQVPAPTYGRVVGHLPEKELSELYNQARSCVSAGAYTAAVLSCRKLLMHVAVNLGADGNKSFAYYVDYLQANNHVTPASEGWLKAIKNRGNEQNHEIRLAGAEEARDILDFSAMLLETVYEYPARAAEHEKKIQQSAGETS